MFGNKDSGRGGEDVNVFWGRQAKQGCRSGRTDGLYVSLCTQEYVREGLCKDISERFQAITLANLIKIFTNQILESISMCAFFLSTASSVMAALLSVHVYYYRENEIPETYSSNSS